MWQLLGGVLLLVSLLAGSAGAVECYNCNSVSDKDCEPIQKKSTTKGQNCAYCMKLQQTLDGVSGKPEVFNRYCMTMGESSNTCVKGDLRSSIKVEVCSCNTDLCNSAPASFTRAHVWMSVILAVYLLFCGSI